MRNNFEFFWGLKREKKKKGSSATSWVKVKVSFSFGGIFSISGRTTEKSIQLLWLTFNDTWQFHIFLSK